MNDPARINEKWIAIIIWAALLYLLFLTTSNGAVTGFGGNVRNFYASFFASGLFPDRGVAVNTSAVSTAVVTLVMAVVLVYQLFDAWLKFIHLTNALLIAFVQSTLPGDHNPILFELLNFQTSRKTENITENNEDENEEVVETDPEEAIGSLVGGVLKAVAISWVIMILTPGIIILISLIGH